MHVQRTTARTHDPAPGRAGPDGKQCLRAADHLPGRSSGLDSGAGQNRRKRSYHRLFWLNDGEGEQSAGSLTPGVRWGLQQSPLVGDIGLTSVIISGGGALGTVLGPALGIGFQTRNFCFVVRPSAYTLSFYGGGVHIRDPLWQVSLLAGNSAQSGKSHISCGCRAGKLGGGPVLLIDGSVGPVNLRLEGLCMLQYETYVYGPYSNGQLTVGLVVGGPTPSRSADDDRTEGMKH